MKSIIKTITVKAKNVMMAVVLITLTIVNTTQANATEKSKNAEPLPIEVKSLGSIDAQPLIRVHMPNEKLEEGTISLMDDNGDVIFTDHFQAKPYSKTFRLNTGATINDLNLKVIITNKSNKKTQVYQIANTTRTIQEVVVSQVTY